MKQNGVLEKPQVVFCEKAWHYCLKKESDRWKMSFQDRRTKEEKAEGQLEQSKPKNQTSVGPRE